MHWIWGYAIQAAVLAAFLYGRERPKTAVEWGVAAAICLGWPIFIIYACWPARRR